MKKSEILRIIREEVEVVLTNAEVIEMFDLDPAALLEAMMKEDEDDSPAAKKTRNSVPLSMDGKKIGDSVGADLQRRLPIELSEDDDEIPRARRERSPSTSSDSRDGLQDLRNYAEKGTPHPDSAAARLGGIVGSRGRNDHLQKDVKQKKVEYDDAVGKVKDANASAAETKSVLDLDEEISRFAALAGLDLQIAENDAAKAAKAAATEKRKEAYHNPDPYEYKEMDGASIDPEKQKEREQASLVQQNNDDPVAEPLPDVTKFKMGSAERPWPADRIQQNNDDPVAEPLPDVTKKNLAPGKTGGGTVTTDKGKAIKPSDLYKKKKINEKSNEEIRAANVAYRKKHGMPALKDPHADQAPQQVKDPGAIKSTRDPFARPKGTPAVTEPTAVTEPRHAGSDDLDNLAARKKKEWDDATNITAVRADNWEALEAAKDAGYISPEDRHKYTSNQLVAFDRSSDVNVLPDLSRGPWGWPEKKDLGMAQAYSDEAVSRGEKPTYDPEDFKKWKKLGRGREVGFDLNEDLEEIERFGALAGINLQEEEEAPKLSLIQQMRKAQGLSAKPKTTGTFSQTSKIAGGPTVQITSPGTKPVELPGPAVSTAQSTSTAPAKKAAAKARAPGRAPARARAPATGTKTPPTTSPVKKTSKEKEDDMLSDLPFQEHRGELDRWGELTGLLGEKGLSAAERRSLPNSDFALPGKGEGPKGKQAGSYPIPDESHGRSALSMVAKHGTAEEKAKVRGAVKRKFPRIEQGNK